MKSHWALLSVALGRLLGVLGVSALFAVALAAFARRARAQKKAAKIYGETIKSGMSEPMTLHPEIDRLRCAGCGACVKACPEGDIIQLIDHKAVLVSPTKCVGHGECEASCPFDAIQLVFGTKTRGMELPRVTTHFETNVPGIYIVGELGGMGLIRNAVKQGRLAMEHAAATLSHRGSVDSDILIVGAGPAGLSASLAAIGAKKSYICIEQSSFGGTIYNFPRQKVVMSHPADLPLIGPMRFERNKISKEDLLGYWNQVRRKTGLKVNEGCRFINLENHQDFFEVETTKGMVRTRKVILAMGVRGTPRRLGVPGEDLPKVTYNLLEPEQYQGRHVIVIGGGNAGVEAAQQLAQPKYRNLVTLLVRSQKFDRCNQENQDIIFSMARKRLVDIRFSADLKSIVEDRVTYQHNGKVITIKNDFVFIFAGADMPFKFLQGLGVAIDKKFGEPIRKA